MYNVKWRGFIHKYGSVELHDLIHPLVWTSTMVSWFVLGLIGKEISQSLHTNMYLRILSDIKLHGSSLLTFCNVAYIRCQLSTCTFPWFVTPARNDIPYTRKFSPGENFRQFRQCMSLAKFFSANFSARWKFWHIEIFPHVEILHAFSLSQSAVVPDIQSLFFLDL